MPRFSVIIPVYNCENLIKQCIESFLAQNYEDYEIIAIDDCSTDNTLSVLKSIISDKLIVIEQEKNGGSAVARNSGIKQAKGEYLWFVDADDAVTNDSFKKLDYYVSNNTVDTVIFDYYDVDSKLSIIDSKKGSEFDFDIVSPLEEKEVLIQTPCGWNKIFKKILFEDKDLWFLEGNWFEDFATTPKILAKSESVGYLKEPLYLYVQNDSSKTHTQSLERNLETIDAMESIKSFFVKNGLFESCFEELQYMAEFHAYRLPSIRIVKVDYSSELLKSHREYMDSNFSSWENNKYNDKYMCKKDKFVLILLDQKQYWLLNKMLNVLIELKNRERSDKNDN